jgi:hypothetical protein
MDSCEILCKGLVYIQLGQDRSNAAPTRLFNDAAGITEVI